MKRKGSQGRGFPFPQRFVRPNTNRQPDPALPLSANGQRSLRTRKIFVIKQVRRLESATSAHKKIRRILIFDDHPDSLRLVFESGANPHPDLSLPQRVSRWKFILVSILTMVVLIGMFWPLF